MLLGWWRDRSGNNFAKTMIFNREFSVSVMKNAFAILFSLCLVLLISYKVVPFYGGITYTDAAYFWNFDESYAQVGGTYSENYLGADQSNGVFGFFSKGVFIFLLRSLGMSHNLISYLTSFGFVFLSSVVAFFVFKRISGDRLFGLFSAAFFILNNISLEYIAYGGMVFHFLSSISFLLLCYIFWLSYSEHKLNYKSVAACVVVSLLNIHAFYLLMYLMLLTGFFLFAFFSRVISRKEVILKYVLSIFGIVIINSYWISPFVYGPLSGDSQTTYNNTGVVLKGFLSVVSYVNSINFFQYGNFFALNFHQTIFHYLFYFSLPIVFFWAFFFSKKREHAKILLFLAILYLVFFNLALGPMSRITGGVWLYLWDHIPVFSFSEALRDIKRLLYRYTCFVFLFLLCLGDLSGRRLFMWR